MSNFDLFNYFINKKKICLVIALVIGVIVYRISLMVVFRNEDEAFYSLLTSISAACINLFIILLLSRFYSWLAVKLTDMGNINFLLLEMWQSHIIKILYCTEHFHIEII